MFAAVITTIQEPTRGVVKLVEKLAECGGLLVVAGDIQGPAHFRSRHFAEGCRIDFLALADHFSDCRSQPAVSGLSQTRSRAGLNQLESVVRIIPSAISDSRDTEVRFFSRANEIDVTASLVKSVGDTKELKVANTQLDDYLPLIRGPVRLLKIDVEGAELKLLRRGKELLKAHKPILTIEVHAFAFPQFSTSLKEFREFLNGLGYDEEILPGTSLRNGLHYQAVYRDRNHQPREIGA
jgi:FkbM family methyltransferase